MAVAIPLLMTAAGASTAVTLGVSLAAGITGLSASIDRAATKVFGKDLVQIGNIAGAIALATGSVPDLSGATSAGASAGTLAGNGAEILGGAIDAGGLNLAGDGVLAQAGGASGGLTLDPVSASGGGLDLAGSAAQASAEVGTKAALTQPLAANSGATSATGGSWTDKLSGTWKSLGDKGQAAAVQVGGSLLTGAASGYANAQAQKDVLDEQRRNNETYRTGSHLRYSNTRRGVLSGG